MALPTLPPGWLGDTLAMYAAAGRRGAVLARRNWPVGLVVVLYGVLLGLVGVAAAPLGPVGGLLVYLASAACLSSWLSLVAEVIRSGRIRLQDLPSSFLTYLNELLIAGFMVWGFVFIASLLVGPVSSRQIVFWLVLVALPEVIYLGRHVGFDMLVETWRFIAENWIEWLPANLLLGAVVVAVQLVVPRGPFGILGLGVSGIVLYFVMIVRGLLFLELSSTSRRSREFRRRATS